MQQMIQYRDGATVYGAEGDKIGTIRGQGGNYIVVEKGFFFPTDYYIPVDAIASSTEDEIYLSISKDAALEQGWDIEPTDDLATAPHISDMDARGAGSEMYQTNNPGTRASQDDMGVQVETDVTAGDVLSVPVHEERMAAEKRTEQAGEVRINKHVVTEQETIEVPVREERVRVEYRPAGTGAGDAATNFEAASFEVPVSREVVDVKKRTVKTGEVEVSREVDEHMEQVSDTVRREVVDVDDSQQTGSTNQSR